MVHAGGHAAPWAPHLRLVAQALHGRGIRRGAYISLLPVLGLESRLELQEFSALCAGLLDAQRDHPTRVTRQPALLRPRCCRRTVCLRRRPGRARETLGQTSRVWYLSRVLKLCEHHTRIHEHPHTTFCSESSTTAFS